MTRVDALAADLHRLQRGRGIQSPEALDRLGHTLGSVVFPDRAPDPGVGRMILWQRLEACARELPTDMRAVFLAALASSDESATLATRLEAVGHTQDRLLRTMKRRLIVANLAVAQVLDREALISPDENPFAVRGWYVESVVSNASIGSRPRFESIRQIRCSIEGLVELQDSFSIPQPKGGDGSTEEPIVVETLAGCESASLERFSPSTWRLHVRLPKPLLLGELHEVGLAITWPSLAHIRPYNVAVPVRETRAFAASVTFEDSSKVSVWQYDGVPPAAIDDHEPNESARIIETGERIEASWSTVRRGLAYGLAWQSC